MRRVRVSLFQSPDPRLLEAQVKAHLQKQELGGCCLASVQFDGGGGKLTVMVVTAEERDGR